MPSRVTTTALAVAAILIPLSHVAAAAFAIVALVYQLLIEVLVFAVGEDRDELSS
jgi:hypothetical protein